MPGYPWCVVFPERKMLNLLIKDALKSLGKVLALCLIVFLAASSFVVSLFLLGLGIRLLRKKAKALEATEREAAREAVDKAREQGRHEVQKCASAVAPVPTAASVQTPPARQYARSAVVIPFKKSGTD
jgi:predicted peroxiredoxin